MPALEVKARRIGGATWWTWQRNAFSRICRIHETEDEYGEQTAGVRHRRSLQFLTASIWCRTGEDFNVENDLLSSDDTPYLCRADISGNDNIEWRTLSSWIIASGSLPWISFQFTIWQSDIPDATDSSCLDRLEHQSLKSPSFSYSFFQITRIIVHQATFSFFLSHLPYNILSKPADIILFSTWRQIKYQ